MSLADSFTVLVNVQSPAASTRDSHGNFTSWGAVRAIYVREESSVERNPSEKGETKSTSYFWTSLDEVKTIDRLWLGSDAQVDPVAVPPTAGRARHASKVEYFPGAGAHWEVTV